MYYTVLTFTKDGYSQYFILYSHFICSCQLFTYFTIHSALKTSACFNDLQYCRCFHHLSGRIVVLLKRVAWPEPNHKNILHLTILWTFFLFIHLRPIFCNKSRAMFQVKRNKINIDFTVRESKTLKRKLILPNLMKKAS